jgi:hypothetical protein
MNSFEKHMDAAHQELLAAQKRLNAEISSYPSPISGCDAQFNYLLAARTRISEALNALDRDVFVPTSRQPVDVHELGQN